MVTNYPRSISSQSGLSSTTEEARALGSRVMQSLHQLYCGLHGHDSMLHFEQERMALRCASCGHESSGWSLDEAPPVITVRGDVLRHRIARTDFSDERRIA